MPIYMPMTHDAEKREACHRAGAAALEAVLDTGENVVFLTLGDPTIYSTFSYLQARVEADGYETALVSGVPSFCAAAARLNVPLAEWNEPLHIIPAVHRAESLPTDGGNYILMKSGSKIGQVKELLRGSGLRVMMVENCGMPNERVYRSAEAIPEDASYYSIIVAKQAGV